MPDKMPSPCPLPQGGLPQKSLHMGSAEGAALCRGIWGCPPNLIFSSGGRVGQRPYRSVHDETIFGAKPPEERGFYPSSCHSEQNSENLMWVRLRSRSPWFCYLYLPPALKIEGEGSLVGSLRGSGAAEAIPSPAPDKIH